MSKVLFIGIDGMDTSLVQRYRERMPNLWGLIERGKSVELHSTLPPDSNTAWASIYTGLNPAQHGFVHFLDPLNRIQLINAKEVGEGVVAGKAFWDHAGNAGKKVSLVLPHLGYPVWPVNGTMIGRSTIGEAVGAYPQGLLPAETLDGLNTIKGFPGKASALPGWIAKVEAAIEREASVGLERMRMDEWDLFFWYSSALDLAMHFLWHYSDPADPAYPGPNRYEGVIGDLHARYDAILGRFLAAAPEDVSVVVCSDHGHGMRPVRLLNVNEVLRREGLFFQREGKPGARAGAQSLAIRALERGKRLALDVVGKYNLGSLASKALRYLPAARKVFTSPLSIDWERTLAYTTDLSGIKAYSYGGIIVRRDQLTASAYEDVRERIIQTIKGLRDPESGEPVARIICRREELYAGEHLDRYPDIVFDLRYGLGAGWAADGQLFGTSGGHSLVPGSHKHDSAVLVIVAPEAYEVGDAPASLTQIAPTVLALLDVPCEELGFDSEAAVTKKVEVPQWQ